MNINEDILIKHAISAQMERRTYLKSIYKELVESGKISNYVFSVGGIGISIQLLLSNRIDFHNLNATL